MAHGIHLCRVQDTYYFRLRVPQDLKTLFKRDEIKKTLKTKNLTTARKKLKPLAAETEKLFMLVRSGVLTDAQIDQLMREYFLETLELHEAERAEHGPQVSYCEDVGAWLPKIPYEDFREAAVTDLQEGTTDYIGRIADEFLTSKGVEIARDSLAYKKLCRQLLLAHIETLQIDQERDAGFYGHDLSRYEKTSPAAPPSEPSPTLQPEKTEGKPLPISEVIQKYIANYRLSESCTENSVKEYESACATLPFIIGDKDIREVTRDDIRRYLEELKTLPNNRTKKHPNKTLEQLKKLKGEKPISAGTVLKYLNQIKGLLKFAEREEFIPRSPAEGINFKPPKRQESSIREAFSKEDLQNLVSGLVEEDSQGGLKGKPERLWIPLIALYGGMRLNEICQLHVQDVQEEQGIWYFNVTNTIEEGEAKTRIKTEAGVRQVPIHPTLIDLGFLDYFQKVKTKGEKQLWSNLTKTERGYHRRFANWFLGTTGVRSFKDTYVTSDPKRVFHSFRHNFTDALKQNLIDSRVIDELVGHKHGSLSHDRYGKPYTLRIRLEAVQTIDYGIELDQLKGIAGKL